jgi:hypothetical protein
MASLDTISTLTEFLDKDGFDYIIICVQDSKDNTQARVDIFHGIDKKNKEVIQDSLSAMADIIEDKDFEFRKNKKRKKKKNE